MTAADTLEPIPDFDEYGVRAFTTTRATGTFGTGGQEPVSEVMDRWDALRRHLGAFGSRLATAKQVHGSRVVVHDRGWEGWLRTDAADGHVARTRGTALAVTVADCVPVFLAHRSGAVALLHSGWRGTAAGILAEGVAALAAAGAPPGELRLHLGPAICGSCYEVSPDVYAKITGRTVDEPSTVDLRAVLADQARRAGVREIAISPACTRCDGERFFSHRGGDSGRQLGVIVAAAATA